MSQEQTEHDALRESMENDRESMMRTEMFAVTLECVRALRDVATLQAEALKMHAEAKKVAY